MHPKLQFHLLGWITILIFPSIGLWLLWYFEDINVLDVLELNDVFTPKLLLGLEFGLFYGLFILAVTQHNVFKEMSSHQERMLKSLKLNWPDIIFMSFCAAFGEEIFFRAGIQTWLGPWLTTFIFIAVHGYFNPTSLKKSLLGIVLFPFILIISFSYETLGLWFCIGAHFSYDLLMFQGVLSNRFKN
jgi:membrane protease YdiL (CAAX protease family)